MFIIKIERKERNKGQENRKAKLFFSFDRKLKKNFLILSLKRK